MKRPPLLVFAQLYDVMVTYHPRYPTRVIQRPGLPGLLKKMSDLDAAGLTRTILTSSLLESLGRNAFDSVSKLHTLQIDPASDFSQNSARARVLFEVEDAAAAADVSTQSIRAVVFNTEVRAPMWHFDSQVGVTRFKPAFTREERQARRAQGIRPEDDAAMENMAEVIEALANTDMPVGEALPMIPQVRVKPMPDIGSCVLLVNDRIPR